MVSTFLESVWDKNTASLRHSWSDTNLSFSLTNPVHRVHSHSQELQRQAEVSFPVIDCECWKTVSPQLFRKAGGKKITIFLLILLLNLDSSGFLSLDQPKIFKFQSQGRRLTIVFPMEFGYLFLGCAYFVPSLTAQF